MKILFIHNNFPAQFLNLAPTLAADPKNEVVYATMRREDQLPGVKKVYYQPSRTVTKEIHHYLRGMEAAVLNGQAVFRLCLELKNKGFYPDVVYAHAGWGPANFIKEIYPHAKLLCLFEWYYRAENSDFDFLPNTSRTPDDYCRLRMKNSTLLTDLMACDLGICPTHWQYEQYPKLFHAKLRVLHDGINTDYMQPADKPVPLKIEGLDLSDSNEIITYVARGMEPYRGFPEFMRAVELVLKKRPNCHVVIAGMDRVAYGAQLPEGDSYKKRMLDELDFNLDRVHFVGLVPYKSLLNIFQASSVHVYLTVPFVLSWSMLQAMSAGCLVLGSKTAPVEEIIQDGKNGILVDFFKIKQIAKKINAILDHPDDYKKIRKQARETIVRKFSLKDILPRQIHMLETLAKGKIPKKV